MAPFAWQSNKAILFYFTQNSVSEIQFCTGVQRSCAFGIKNIPRFRLFLFILLNICCDSYICRFTTCTVSGKFSAIISSFATHTPPPRPSGTQVRWAMSSYFRLLASLCCVLSNVSISLFQLYPPANSSVCLLYCLSPSWLRI